MAGHAVPDGRNMLLVIEAHIIVGYSTPHCLRKVFELDLLDLKAQSKLAGSKDETHC